MYWYGEGGSGRASVVAITHENNCIVRVDKVAFNGYNSVTGIRWAELLGVIMAHSQ